MFAAIFYLHQKISFIFILFSSHTYQISQLIVEKVAHYVAFWQRRVGSLSQLCRKLQPSTGMTNVEKHKSSSEAFHHNGFPGEKTFLEDF